MKVEIHEQPEKDVREDASDPYGPLSGQVMCAIKDGCRSFLLRRGASRIYEAMLQLDLSCEQEVLGKVYGVLNKRRAVVQSEDLREGSSTFVIVAFLPASESFGL